MGLKVSIILAVIVAVILFVAIVIFALVEWNGINGTRRKVVQNQYPCIQGRDCGDNWGLGVDYTCDPLLKQCRVRSYIVGSCKTDDDCLKITPSCIKSTNTSLPPGTICSHLPYSKADLFGESNLTSASPCNSGLVVNNQWNFCQNDIMVPCKSTDQCANGSCVNGICLYLGDYDICTEGSSYGTHQCAPPNRCTPNPKHPREAYRCQPDGINPGQDNAYCLTDADCDNKNCYHESPSDTVGICASQRGLVGMDCRSSSECTQGLLCNIHSGQTIGTCVLSDPFVQTDLTHCPANQYGGISANGCVKAISPVPCSVGSTCAIQCGAGDRAQLVLGFLGPDQNWHQIYPQFQGADTNHVFTDMFIQAGSIVYLNPRFTMLVSPSMLAVAAQEDYPTITLAPPLPLTPTPQNIADLKGCQPLARGLSLLSSFASQALTNIIFNVEYDPTTIVASPGGCKVQAILVGSPVTNGQTTVIEMLSNTLYADFYVNQNPYASSPIPYNTVFVNSNYHRPQGAVTFPVRAVESGANLPAPWSVASSVKLISPPLISIDLLPPSSAQPTLANCLYVPAGVYMPDIFVHFLYYPSPGETVVSWKFSVLPTQVAGGLTTLVGLYEVERDATTFTGRTRILVVSTLTLYASSKTEAETTAETFFGSGTPPTWAYRLGSKIVSSSPSSSVNIYASVYSFVLIDFEHNWPFTFTLTGPPSTSSDTAGTCDVTFADTSHGKTTVTQGQLIHPFPINSGTYPVFTPRAYTRIQAAISNFTSQWTSVNLFGGRTPGLIDSDMVVMATAGRSSIIGMLLVYKDSSSVTPQPPQTLVLTMRFGDTIPTSRYSIPNISIFPQSHPTKMYGFYLTPEPSETGGGDVFQIDLSPGIHPVTQIKYTFPTPQLALSPVSTSDISSWVTPPFPDAFPPPDIIPDPTPYVQYHMRSVWGCEVFTACLVPCNLTSPVRFFRSPNTNAQSLSTNGGDDVWIWGMTTGSGGGKTMLLVPLFFDNLGIVYSTFPGKPVNNNAWMSSAATTCPPTVDQITVGMDHNYKLNDPNNRYPPLFFAPWDIKPNAQIVFDPKPSPAFNTDPLQLTGRMCQTQGYQDGILYRARPYIFASSNIPDNLPTGVNSIMLNPTTTGVLITSLQSTALAFSSPSNSQAYLPLIGVGSIETLIGNSGVLTYPSLPGIFDAPPSGQWNIIWVGSESGVPLLPGGYRVNPCPSNPRASAMNIHSSYPTACADYGLSGSGDRKPLPICVIYRYTNGPKVNQLEMRLYDIRVTRGNSGYSAKIISDTLIQMNGALATMTQFYAQPPPNSLKGSVMGYPGFNGSPAVVYSPCL